MTDFRIKTILLLLLSILFFCIVSVAQSPQSKIKSYSPWKIKSFAKDANKHGGIYSAIDFYEHYHNLNPDKVNIKWELAELYRKSRDYTKAEEFYKQVYEMASKDYPKALFYYAQMAKMNSKFNEAANLFNTFKKEYKNQPDEQLMKKLVKAETDGCLMALTMKDTALKMVVTHLDKTVNKPYIDYAPIPVDKTTMFYASIIADSIIYYDPEDTANKKPVRKYYMAKKSLGPKDDWKGGYDVPLPINDEDFDVGNGTFSPDGTQFFFTKTIKKRTTGYVTEIWMTSNNGGQWAEPEKMPDPINIDGYSSSQPAVGVSTRTLLPVLYFVSDRPEGEGGLDIWYANYNQKTKSYKSPRKAAALNTVGDEFSPSYDIETHQMFFSSTGWPGMGGFDVFKSIGEEGTWSNPANVGYPVNSPADDIYYIVSKDREKGFFVSNREGGFALKNPTCCDDIYTFRWSEYIHIAIDGYIFEMMEKGKETSNEPEIIYDLGAADSLKTAIVTDSATVVKDTSYTGPKEKYESIIPEATVGLYLVKNNESFFIKNLPSDIEGEYFFDLEQGNDYKIMVEKDGYFNNQGYFTTKDVVTSDTLFLPLELKPIPQEPIVINNIYYDFDKATLTESAKKTIDTTLLTLLTENPSLIVEISSHTDGKGDDSYNLKLSQGRAESVVKYLVEKGVPVERLLPKGYGESKPIAANEKPDGSDNPEGRQLNRRTEFKVIGSKNQFSKLNQNQMIIKRKNPDGTEGEVKGFGSEQMD
ncbi:MAG: hypothetical protein A2W91_04430 [Bacteroidetes bacterium GWF2_38_335]|nr:MAG: hypothetical protein A2W91_04430 [Bacteroidetes bacterium GWF2_38_335]HBS88246.1 hypothetical protein [Bacteroidales bacterium]